jgi:hypothetical protein
MLPHARVDALVGGHRSADQQPPVTSQHPSPFIDKPAPILQATEDLHQQYRVEDCIGERQRTAVPLDQHRTMAVVASAGKDSKHTEGEIDTNIIVAGRDKRPADPPGTRAEVEQARPLAAGSIPA